VTGDEGGTESPCMRAEAESRTSMQKGSKTKQAAQIEKKKTDILIPMRKIARLGQKDQKNR